MADGKMIQFNAGDQALVQIEPAHIINALKCIDTAAQRGAFMGGELSSVGGVRDALYAQVEPVLKKLEEENKAKTETEEKTDTTTTED